MEVFKKLKVKKKNLKKTAEDRRGWRASTKFYCSFYVLLFSIANDYHQVFLYMQRLKATVKRSVIQSSLICVINYTH
jgi:hypothetical protein